MGQHQLVSPGRLQRRLKIQNPMKKRKRSRCEYLSEDNIEHGTSTTEYAPSCHPYLSPPFPSMTCQSSHPHYCSSRPRFFLLPRHQKRKKERQSSSVQILRLGLSARRRPHSSQKPDSVPDRLTKEASALSGRTPPHPPPIPPRSAPSSPGPDGACCTKSKRKTLPHLGSDARAAVQ